MIPHRTAAVTKWALIIVFLGGLWCMSACDTGRRIDITNRTAETLAISFLTEPGNEGEQEIGELAPGLELGVASSRASAITVKARNDKDQIVWQRRFAFNLFSKRDLSITIMPQDLIQPSR
jgi:hypothetical protein